ncbi:MAG: YhgN family NAAT transporter [Enterobacterales bacterium]
MNSIISDAVLLFLIIDPLGNLPIFMSTLKHLHPNRRLAIIIREMLISLFIMTAFLFFGENILSFINIKTEIVSIAGGVILFLISMQMIFLSKKEKNNSLLENKEPFLIPLSMPLIAGPSVLATLMSLSNKYQYHNMQYLFLSLFIAWLVSSLILMLSNVFLYLLSNKGIEILEKLMGLVLIMISIQMFLGGLKYFLICK